MQHPLDRRRFLGTASVVFGGASALTAAEVSSDHRPPVTNPRATSGDARYAPKWDEMFTLTVGNDKADLCGRDERVIQAAVDTIARMGGGTVRLLPGQFKLRNAVYLCSNLRLIGSGPETILMKEPSVTSKLAADSDWYDQEITLADAAGFKVGDGVCLRARTRTTAAIPSSSARWSLAAATASSSTRVFARTFGPWASRRPRRCFPS